MLQCHQRCGMWGCNVDQMEDLGRWSKEKKNVWFLMPQMSEFDLKASNKRLLHTSLLAKDLWAPQTRPGSSGQVARLMSESNPSFQMEIPSEQPSCCVGELIRYVSNEPSLKFQHEPWQAQHLPCASELWKLCTHQTVTQRCHLS